MGLKLSIPGVGGLEFGKSDAAHYKEMMQHMADRQLDAVRDTNATSTRNLQLQLNAQNRSELHWMDYLEGVNENAFAQNSEYLKYFALTSGSPLAALYAFNS